MISINRIIFLIVVCLSIQTFASDDNVFDVRLFRFGPNPFVRANVANHLTLNYYATRTHQLTVYGYTIYGEQLFATHLTDAELSAQRRGAIGASESEIIPQEGKYRIQVHQNNELQLLPAQLVIIVARFRSETKEILKRGYLVVK